MLEYDQNLPQEFGHKPDRLHAGLQAIVLTLTVVALVYALTSSSRSWRTTRSRRHMVCAPQACSARMSS